MEKEINKLVEEFLNSQYEASKVEPVILKFWEEKKLYKKDFSDTTAGSTDNKDLFVIVLPPPNVTGVLHIGHVFEHTFSDFLVRFNKLSGQRVVWIPGSDHAGIATQNVVEKNLLKQNIRRDVIGREKFLEYVWEWVKKCESEIKNQCKRLGSFLHWDYYSFTMDEKRSYAVSFAFEKLYNEGFIYRDKYIVNYCPKCKTVLSDDEVVHKEIQSKLYYLKYPLLKDKNRYITIATVRPETILADVAVAAHPEDERYKALLGEKVLLPIVNRELPVIADNYVDPKFGTGALKITPGHDFNDYTIGKRHNLAIIDVIDSTGKMNENAYAYKGLDRFECRKKIVEDLKNAGFVEKIEDYKSRVGFCYRCDTVIEPNVSLQWFVKMNTLARMVKDRYNKGEFILLPKKFEGIFYHWIDNVRDWCISRQLWWGHRIPFYTCNKCHYEFAKAKTPSECPKCKNVELKQDEDVLDTWFSSWLWPMSTTGWLDNEKRFSALYPNTLLTSAWEILFFWDIRMLMAGIFFTGKVPFKTLLIHGLVRDESNKKFSKSSGNAPDVNKLIEQFGADGLRGGFALNSNFDEECVLLNIFPTGKHFANKLWNAFKFFVFNAKNLNYSLHIDKSFASVIESNDTIIKWIYTELYDTINEIKNVNKTYEFLKYTKGLYKFFWNKFCDWYIEITKEKIKNGDTKYIDIGLEIIRRFIVWWHPVQPFVTEFVHQALYKVTNNTCSEETSSILFEKLPFIQIDNSFYESKEIIENVIKLEEFFRLIKYFKKVKGKGTFQIRIASTDSKISEVIDLIKNFENVEIKETEPDIYYAIEVFNNKVLVKLDKDEKLLKFLVDKLNEQIREKESLLKDADTKLTNKEFLESAGSDVIDNYKKLQLQINKELTLLGENVNRLSAIN